MITNEELDELKKIWQEDHPGEEISQEQLLDMAERLITATEIVYKPIPKDKADKFKEITAV